MVAQTRGGVDKENSPTKLRFKEKLVGKGLSNDVLQKKLKALHTELAQTDQERVDLNSLAFVRDELINNAILLHKDKGVKAYAACCLADLLRLYAPDAPYTARQLKDIFGFFFRQLALGIKGPDAPYYNEYFHLLESLSSVKSVVLVCDLPEADDLMSEAFRIFFDLVRQDLAKNVEFCMSEILTALIDESQSLPAEVLEIIMAQFLHKNARMEQPAFRLAVQVCNGTADRLQRNVCQYFTDIIVQHPRDEDDEDFESIQTAHTLIKQLHRFCPSLLLNVIPQLEEELRVDELQIRVMATQVLGQMFADKGGTDLAKKYPSTWNLWLARKNDIAAAVRIAMLESVHGLLSNTDDLRPRVEDVLQAKLMDPDEKVRAITCKIFSQMDYETALHHVSDELLRAVGGRCLDRKSSVREEAFRSLGQLYRLAHPEIEDNDPAAIKQFAWIPQQILQASVTSVELKYIAEQTIAQYIIPLPSKGDDEVIWMDQLLTIMKYLDFTGVKNLLGLTGLKLARPSIYERFIQSCVESNGGTIDENEDVITRRHHIVIQQIASSHPDHMKAAENLKTFAKMNEARLYKLMKTCMDPQTDLKTLTKSSVEFLRRIEQAQPSILPTMTTVLRRSSFWIVNTSSIGVLIKRLEKSPDTINENPAYTLLTYISKNCPAILKAHLGAFSKCLSDENNPRLVEVSLQGLAAVSRLDREVAPNDKRTLDKAVKYALQANSRHSKFAARLLAHTKQSDELCTQIVESISERLQNANDELRLAHIAVLAQFAQFSPHTFELKSEFFIGFLLRDIVMQPAPVDENVMDTEDEWADNEDVTYATKAKVLAIKVCTNRSLAHSKSDSALDISNPLMKMLFTILEHNGSLTADVQDDPKVKSRLRAQAATCLLRLGAVEALRAAITQNFALLALVMQDSCFQVREKFIAKLILLLAQGKLGPNYNVILFITAHDPEREIRDMASKYVSTRLRANTSEYRLVYFDMIFVRLLHLLAHHPDFFLTSEALQDIAKYVEFYLELVATPENASLLYHLAQKTKTVRDSESEDYSKNLYAMSELAQHIIKARAKLHSWTLNSYPGKVKLPSDIFKALPNPEIANKIMRTVYLPEDLLKQLGELGKLVKSPNAKSRTAARSSAPRKRKASNPKTIGGSKRTRVYKKRRKSWESDDEDENASPVSDSFQDEQMASPEKDSEVEKTDENADGPSLPQLGRGARGRAKALEKKKVKRGSNGKQKENEQRLESSDG